MPLIVHYGLLDLLFLLTHFVTPTLPDTWADVKQLVRHYFPVIYDTKAMAVERSVGCFNLSLGDVFDKISSNSKLRALLPNMDENEEPSTQKHEAAYDAYMTAVCFVGLCQEVQSRLGTSGGFPWQPDTTSHDELRHVFVRNALYQSSLYTIDLENATLDRMKCGFSLESTFVVSRLDPSLSPRSLGDQVKQICTSSLPSSSRLETWRLQDDVIMVALHSLASPLGTSGVSAATSKTVMQGQASALDRAIRRMFPLACIVRLDKYLVQSEFNNVTSSELVLPSPWFYRWLDFIPWLFSTTPREKLAVQNEIILD